MPEPKRIGAEELCHALLLAETEEKVSDILKLSNLWNRRDVWRPYGDISNNRGIVGNQQSSPVAALVEKLVNSIDALLITECERKGLDPTNSKAPSTMQEAVKRFFNVKGGVIHGLDAGERTILAERIQLVATGSKTEPNYIIIDDGEGQNPDDFPNTFLSLLRENKTKIPFVQGKFNMGGTGVLQFTGRHSFQLIISRRQQDLQSADNKWGFTIIRRIEPEVGQPHSLYVYLAPDNKVLSFEAEYITAMPGKYPEVYARSMVAGTCIKLWNYKLPGRLKSIITLDLRYALERYLPDPALPVRLIERRQGYRAHTYDTTMSGLVSVIADNPNNIEPGLDTGTPLDVPNVGQVNLRLVLIKENVEDDRYPSGIFFNVNGQLHSEWGKDFISKRTKLDYIADSLIVLVDCTSLPARVREDLFLASRDRMRLCEERTSLEESIAEYLKDHQGLREANARRRQARLSTISEEETIKIIQSLVRFDPTLANLFGTGEKIKIPSGPFTPVEPYSGRKFPTFFRLAKEPKGGLVRKCPKNRTAKIEFETDADNDYFSRAIDPGILECKGVPIRKSVHLWNGKANVRFSIPDACNVGDKYGIKIFVSDISRVQPFESSFCIEIEPEALPSESTPSQPKFSGLVGIPNIIDVFQKDWQKYSFNEQSGLEIRNGEGDSLDVYINMDNLYLKSEIGKRRMFDPELLKYWFKYGLFLLAMGMLYHQKNTRETDDEKGSQLDFASISMACKGLAVTIIPIMCQLRQEKKYEKKTE